MRPVGLCRIWTAESVVLTPCPPGPLARHRDLQVGGVDLDVHLLGLRQHRHGHRRGVDPPVRLGHRHPLHPVDAALELQLPVDVRARDQEDHLLESAPFGRAAAHGLHLPALGVGVLLVHPRKLGRKERRLLPSRSGPNLHHRVARIGGSGGIIARSTASRRAARRRSSAGISAPRARAGRIAGGPASAAASATSRQPRDGPVVLHELPELLVLPGDLRGAARVGVE